MGLIKPRTGTAAASSRPRVGTTRPAAAARVPAGFQYTRRTSEQVRDRASRALGGRDSYFTQDVQFFTPRVGDNCVRILPPPTPEKAAEWGHYGVGVAVHYSIGADESAYLCAAKMKGEDCVLCTERAKANSAGEEELADALKPGHRVAVWIVDRAQENKGPLLWNMPAGTDKDVTKLCIDPASGEALLVDDPEGGYDLMFTREGEGLKTKYKGIQFARKDSPLHDDPAVMAEWLQYVVEHPLDECLVFYPQDHIAKVFEGQAAPAGDAPPAAAPAARTRVQPRTAARATPTAAQAAVPAARAAIRPRGAAAQPAPEPEPAPPAGEWPTWEELQLLDEDALAALGDEAQLTFPESFDSIEALRAWVAEQLQIEEPEPEPAAAAAAAPAGSWRDRLKNLNKK